MGTIALEGLKFHGYHGLHDTERKNGNSFIVDIELEVDFDQAAKIDNIDQTIDYEEVYMITKKQMEGSSYLLEHIAYKILSAIKERYEGLNSVKVKVSKLNPPVGGDCAKATVVIEG